jgi:putative NADPH-quinone reductase
MKQVLIINGHPDKESYNYAVSEAFLKGASKTNAILIEINIFRAGF